MIYKNPEEEFITMTDGGEGEGEGAGEGEGSGTGVLENSIPAAGAGEGEAGKEKPVEFKVPENYVNEGWAKDLKSEDDVYKKLAGAESLIGKQLKIPNAETTPEDRDKFFDQLRPEKAEEYTFNRDNQTEEMKAFADEKLDGAVKDLFHKAKLQQWQVDIIQGGYENDILGGILQETAAQKEAANKVFDDLAKQTFGDGEAKIMETAKKLIDAHTPEGFKDQLSDLSDQKLMAMAGLLNEIQKKYISEDTLNTLGDSISAEGEASLYQKGKELMASPEYQDEFNPKHDAVKAEVNDIFKRLGAIKK